MVFTIKKGSELMQWHGIVCVGHSNAESFLLSALSGNGKAGGADECNEHGAFHIDCF
jgi:hypothetical protein